MSGIAVTTPQVDGRDVHLEWHPTDPTDAWISEVDHYVLTVSQKVTGGKHTVSGLKPGGEYIFTVEAVGNNGESLNANGEATATTVH